jgi:hypothetical protein
MFERVRLSSAALGIGIGASLVVPFTATTASAEAGGNESLQFCRFLSQFYEGNIIGPCTSYFQSHNNNAAATTRYFCRTEIVPAGDFETLGECVSTITKAGGL